MIRSVVLAAAALVAAGPAARAGFIIANGEADVEILYDRESRSLGVEIHLDETDEHVETDEAIFYGSTDASPLFRRTINNTAVAAALGIAPGSQAFVFPQIENPALPYIGIAAAEEPEETPNGFFDGPLTLTFLGVSGPGTFALWQAGEDPVAGIGSGNAVSVPLDGHQHYNWGFSQEGFYEVRFKVSGTLTDGTFVEGEEQVLNFAVNVNPVPAPPGLVLAAVGGVTMAGVARLRRRRAATA